MSDNVWIIYQYGEPIAAFSNVDEALKEFGYLSYHGDGYKIKPLELEDRAGGYAQR